MTASLLIRQQRPWAHWSSQQVQNDQANPELEYKITRQHTGVREIGKGEHETHLTRLPPQKHTTNMGRRTKGPRVGLHMANGPEPELAKQCSQDQ